MGRLLILTAILFLPACIGTDHYVHNTDTQETQRQASYAEAARMAQQEAAMAAMMGQLNNMASQMAAARGQQPQSSIPPTQGFVMPAQGSLPQGQNQTQAFQQLLNQLASQSQGGNQQDSAAAFQQLLNQLANQSQGGNQQDSAAAFQQLLNQFANQSQGGNQQDSAAAFQQLLNQFANQSQGGNQQDSTAALQQFMNQFMNQAQPNQQGATQQIQGIGSEFDLITRFVRACQGGDNRTAATILAEATARYSKNPEHQTALNQMTNMMNAMNEASSSSTPSSIPSRRADRIQRAQSGFQTAQSSTMQNPRTRRGFLPASGSGFQPARQGDTRQAQDPGFRAAPVGISQPSAGTGSESPVHEDTGAESAAEDADGRIVPSKIGFMGIAPGKSKSPDIRSNLGSPVKRMSRGTEYFESKGKGIAQAAVAYDDEGVVRWARVRLVNQLSPELAEIAFNVMGPAGQSDGCAFADNEDEGWTAHYVDKGIHFYVRDGIVCNVWFTLPDQDLAEVRLD